MPGNGDGQREPIYGWDAIAAELKVSVRQAQKWEELYHLPVYRLAGKKGRVWAYPDELRSWERTSAQSNPAAPAAPEVKEALAPVVTAPETAARTGGRGMLYGGLALVLLSAAVWAVTMRHGPPDHFEVHERDLRMLDSAGREVWRRLLPRPMDPYVPVAGDSRFWVGSLSGHRGISSLFTYGTHPRVASGSELQCYDEAGNPLWTFRPGRAVTDGWRTYSPLYSIDFVHVLPANGNSPMRIVVTSNHVESYPDQVAVLDTNGKLLGEYWHSGHLLSMAVEDLDGDGKPELVMAGVNNGYQEGTLIVLDPDRLQGASDQTNDPHFQLRGFPIGVEKAIVRFPRDRANQKFYDFNRAYQLTVMPDMISVAISETTEMAGPYILYHLSRRLELQSVEESNAVRSRYRELVAEGKLDHAFDDRDRENLKRIEVIRR